MKHAGFLKALMRLANLARKASGKPPLAQAEAQQLRKDLTSAHDREPAKRLIREIDLEFVLGTAVDLGLYPGGQFEKLAAESRANWAPGACRKFRKLYERDMRNLRRANGSFPGPIAEFYRIALPDQARYIESVDQLDGLVAMAGLLEPYDQSCTLQHIADSVRDRFGEAVHAELHRQALQCLIERVEPVSQISLIARRQLVGYGGVDLPKTVPNSVKAKALAHLIELGMSSEQHASSVLWSIGEVLSAAQAEDLLLRIPLVSYGFSYAAHYYSRHHSFTRRIAVRLAQEIHKAADQLAAGNQPVDWHFRGQVHQSVPQAATWIAAYLTPDERLALAGRATDLFPAAGIDDYYRSRYLSRLSEIQCKCGWEGGPSELVEKPECRVQEFCPNCGGSSSLQAKKGEL